MIMSHRASLSGQKWCPRLQCLFDFSNCSAIRCPGPCFFCIVPTVKRMSSLYPSDELNTWVCSPQIPSNNLLPF